VSRSALRLTAGEAGRFDDARSFRVVEATALADGRCEFLAVAPLPGAELPADEGGQPRATGGVAVSALPLPYPLPE
jgi:hypothetical protein